MKSVDIFSLTRIENGGNLRRLERQMSERHHFLNIKTWEIDCLREVADKLYQAVGSLEYMNFFYSFQIPKLGKEFDLLRITNDYVINVELKSGDVTDEKVRKQLMRNRYYLNSLGKAIRSYTYIRDEDRLVRLTNSENLVESDFEKLAADLIRATGEYCGDVEELFKEENYIISPLSDPERFLRRDYFLTSQQNDIRNSILRNVKENGTGFYGFTGLPGTGKTLLLYDIAMELSHRQKVCVLHFGSFPEELEKLDERLKRIDFFKCHNGSKLLVEELDEYSVLFVDEGHRISENYLELIKNISVNRHVPVIISYDSEDAISPEERPDDPALRIEKLGGFVKYKLTNRIRMNSELSSFINCLMRPSKYRRKAGYPNIDVAYANDFSEAAVMINKYTSGGYVYIADSYYDGDLGVNGKMISAQNATCREFDKVVMLVDSSFSYDGEYLRCSMLRDGESGVRMLFHGLNRAKLKLAIVIVENEEILDKILGILQGDNRG